MAEKHAVSEAVFAELSPLPPALAGGKPLKTLQLSSWKQQAILGRIDTSDLQVSHGKISGKHLFFCWEEGRCRMSVLGSFGVYLNGTYLPKDAEAQLNDKDTLTLARRPKDTSQAQEALCSFRFHLRAQQVASACSEPRADRADRADSAPGPELVAKTEVRDEPLPPRGDRSSSQAEAKATAPWRSMTRKSSPAEVSEEELAKARAEIEAVENRLRPAARSSKSEPESAEEELAKTRAEIEKTEEDLRRCEKEGAQHSPQKPQKAGISREARIGVLHPGSPVPCGTPITPAPGYNLAAAIANATNSGKAEPDTRPVPPPPPLDQMGVFVRGAPLSSLELPVPPPPPLALPPLDPRIQGPRAVPESPMGGARGRTPCRGASRTPYRGPQPESPYRGARSRTPYRGHVPDSPAGARSRTPGRGYRSPTRGRSVGRSGTPARGSCESPARAPPQAPPKIPVPPLWEKVMVVLVQAMRLDQETIDLLQTIPLEKAAELCVAAHGDRNPSEHIRHAMSQVMLAAAEMDTDPVKDVYQALDSKAQQMLSQLPSDEAQRALQKASRAQCASAFVVGYARRYWKEQNGEEWKRW